MSYKTPWPAPYPGVSKLAPTERTRLTVEIPRVDANDIIAVALVSSILTAICQYAIKQTVKEIRKNNITYAHQRAFFEYVCQRSYSEFTEKTSAPDDTERVEGVRVRAEELADVSAGIGEKVTEGSRRRRKKV